MRSLKKEIFIDPELLAKLSLNDDIFTKSRASTIVPEMFHRVLFIYNGKKYIKLRIIPEMVGHKLGEFIPTRVYKPHTSLNKVNKKTAKPAKKK